MPSFWGGFGEGWSKGFEKSWDISAQEEKEKKSRKRARRARGERALAQIKSYKEPAFEAAGYEGMLAPLTDAGVGAPTTAKEEALLSLPAGKKATKKEGLVELEAAAQGLARGREDVLAQRADERWAERLGLQKESDIDKARRVSRISIESAAEEFDLTRDAKLGYQRDLLDLNAEFKDDDRHKDYADWFNRLVATRQIKLSDDKQANMRKLASVYGAAGMSEPEMLGLIQQSYPNSVNDGNVGELHAEWSSAIEQYKKGEGDLDRATAMEAAFRYAQTSPTDDNTWDGYKSALKDRGMEHLARRGGVREAFESGKIARKYSTYETTLKKVATLDLRKQSILQDEELADASLEDEVLATSLYQFALQSRDTDDVSDSGLWFIEDDNPASEPNKPIYSERIRAMAKMKLLIDHSKRLTQKDLTDTGKIEIYRSISDRSMKITDDEGKEIKYAKMVSPTGRVTRLGSGLPTFVIIPEQVQKEAVDALGRDSVINEIVGRLFWHPKYHPTSEEKKMVEAVLDSMNKRSAFDRQERGGNKMKLSNDLEVEVEMISPPDKPK